MKRIIPIGLFLLVHLAGQAETLSLEACLKLACQNNPDLIRSEYSLKTAQIAVGQARSSFYPGVSAGASASTSGPVGDYDPEWGWSMSAGVSQTLYRPGLFTHVGLARERKESAELSDRSLRDQIRMTVERYYYQFLTSDTLIGVYRANIRLAEEQIRKMRQMVDLGLRRQSDLLKSEVQRGTFEAQLVREEETRDAYRRGLNVLMGRAPEAPLLLRPVSVGSPGISDLETARTAMIENNPDLLRLRKQIDIQTLSLRVAREAYLPSLSASYSYSRSRGAFGGETVENDQVGLRLSLELFSGFSRNQAVQRERVGLDAARLDFEAALRDQDEKLLNRYKSLDTQNRLIEIHRTNLESAREDLEVVSRQYAAGFSSILDLMDAQLSVLESETSLLRVLYARKMVESEIRKLIGGGG